MVNAALPSGHIPYRTTICQVADKKYFDFVYEAHINHHCLLHAEKKCFFKRTLKPQK